MPVDASAVASVLGVDVQYKDLRGGAVRYLPQQIAVFAQGASASSYSADKWQATSAAAGGAKYGFGSPIHLILRELMPVNGDGVGTIPVTVYPLSDHASGAPAVGDITPSGSATVATSARVRIGGVLSEPFNIPTGAVALATLLDDMADAVNATLHMPFIAANNADTDLTLTAKWEGASGNGITIEVIEEAASGLAFAITQPVDGANNPDVDSALALVGSRWETMAINQMQVGDTATLDKFSTWGEGRWGQLVRRPCVVFTGDTQTTVAGAITVPDARKTDRVNSVLTAPGSVSIPFVVAARQVARIAKVANNNPPTDYVGQRATGLIPGSDGDQWSYTERDQAVKGGASTSQVTDSVVRIEDVVTFYHPVGEEPPPYRDVVDIVKLQNIIYNVDLKFSQLEWASAPLIPDDQPTVNPNARKPKSAKAQLAAIIDSLGLEAIVSDPEAAKASIVATINSSNPKRLDFEATVQLSGNTKIKSATLYWGFYFGQSAAA